MTLELCDGVRVYGTCPSALTPAAGRSLDQLAAVGATVRLSATVKPSGRDPLFGYFSRPTKPALVKTA
jgi:hypothetical protein